MTYESCTGKLHDACLRRGIFSALNAARIVIGLRPSTYDRIRRWAIARPRPPATRIWPSGYPWPPPCRSLSTDSVQDTGQVRASDWLFPRRSRPGEHLTTRQYGQLVDEWVTLVGLDSAGYGTHSLRRTKVALIHRRTGNLRPCQLLLGHTKLERTGRYLGTEADDALVMSAQTDI